MWIGDLAKLFSEPSRATPPAYDSPPADQALEGRGEITRVETEPAAEQSSGVVWSKPGALLPR